MSKIRLSYSTLQSTLMSPHTYLCKQMGLRQFSTNFFEEGKKAHTIIQEHLCGKTPHALLVNTPSFSVVEEKDFDERLRINFPINEKYEMTGFVDALDPDSGVFAEIKTSGKPWAIGDFVRLNQWRVYAIGLSKYTKVYLINTPRDPLLWTPENIKIFNADITPKHKEEALEFINKGIAVIENIKEEIAKEMALKKEKGWNGRSRWCYYTDCSWCENGGKNV